jgi:hypothetical protein
MCASELVNGIFDGELTMRGIQSSLLQWYRDTAHPIVGVLTNGQR